MQKRSLREKLVGNRIYLKKHQVELAQTMYEYIDRDRKRLDQFLPWVEYIKTIEDELDYIKLTHQQWQNCTCFDYGIFDKNSDIYMGNIGVHGIQWEHNNAELGYWILGDFEGQGFMTESVRVLEEHLFDQGFHRIQICCSDLNLRSAGVPKRAGYSFEGILRENSIEKGQYRNTRVYSKLVGE